MKKIILIVLAFGVVMGCCSSTAPDGTVTKSTINCFKMAQDKVCNASPDVLSIADIVINLLKPEITTLIPDSAPYVALATAQSIKDTGCAAITGLNTMIAFIQGLNTKAMLVNMKMGKAATTGINIQPLLNWRDGIK